MKKICFAVSMVLVICLTGVVFSVHSQTVIYNENFDGGALSVTPGGIPSWSVTNTLQVSSPNSYHNVIALNDSSWFVTDVMNLTGYSFVLLEFQHICKIEFFDAAEIFISIDNGTSWTKLTSAHYINNNNSQFITSGDKFTANSYPLLWEPSNHSASPTNLWWMQETFNVSAIAGNQSQVRFRFRMKDANGNGANANAGWFVDDIVVKGMQYLHDLRVDTIFSLTGSFCYAGNEQVSIQISNVGLDTIFGGFQAAYDINGGTPVVETLSSTIAPGDSIVYDFSALINIVLPSVDSTFILKTYVTAASDPFSQNDTMQHEVTFLYLPDAPAPMHDTVPYGTSATLSATPPYYLSWYATPISDVVLDTGATFVTPILYGNTPYYVSSGGGTNNYFIFTEICHYKYSVGAPVGGWPAYLVADDYIEITGAPGSDLDGFTLEQWSTTALLSTHTFPSGTVLSPEGTAIFAVGQMGASVPVPSSFYYHGNGGYTGTFSSTTGAGRIIKDPQNNIIDAVGYPAGTSGYTFPVASGVTASEWSGNIPAAGSTSGIRLIGPYTQDATNWVVSSATYPQNPNDVNQNVEVPYSGCESPRTEVWAIVTGNPAVDAGVIEIYEPVTPTDLSSQDVRVVVQNFGTDPLTSVTINWSHNGIPQTSFNWSGNLTLSEIDSVLIGQVSPVMGNNYLAAWVSNPNLQPDPMPLNDSAFADFEAYEPLCGTYTIGGVGANFNTFADAIYALEYNGITCPVVFNVSAGTYNERIELSPVVGTSSVNTITFRGESGAVIEYSPVSTTDRSAIALLGASHFRFDSLEIVLDPSSTWGWGIYIGNNTENTEITNCSILVNSSSTSTNYCGIVASGSPTSPTTTATGLNNVLISNNTITGGYYGVILYGSSASKISGSVVSGNEITNTYYHGIRYYYTVQPVANENKIYLRSPGITSSSAIYAATNDGPFIFTYNDIKDAGSYGIYLSSVNATAGNPSLLANNSIGGGFTSTGTPYGIYMSSVSFVDIIYNSVLVDNGSGRGIYISTASGMRALNNSFVYSHTGAGYAAYYVASNYFTEHDYNNYYSNGSNFVYYGSARADLTALRAVNQPVGNDQNSVSGNPEYASNTFLFPISSILNNAGTPFLGITDDILGIPRDLVNPDIGAYEYTPMPLNIGVVQIFEPVNNSCYTGSQNVSILITNIGTDTVFGGFTASYSIDYGTPVAEAVSLVVPPDTEVVYTFTTPINFVLTQLDTTFYFKTWVSLPGDTYHFNDTLGTTIKLVLAPDPPLPVHDTIPYGTSATVGASSIGLISWYDTPGMTNFLDTGTTYTTPILYGDTPWYATASSGGGGGSAVIGFTNCYDVSNWSYSHLYGGNGFVDVSGAPASIFIEGPDNTPGESYTFYEITVPTTTIISFDWKVMHFDNGMDGFGYAVDTVLTELANDDAVGFTSVPVNQGQVFAFYGHSYDGCCDSFIAEITNFSGDCPAGCESAPTEVWAIIDPATIPALDAGIVSIDEPISPANLQPNDVNVTLRNFGTNTLTSVQIHWTVNGVPQLVHNWSGSLLTGDTESDIIIGTHTFTLGNNEIIVWTENPNGGVDANNLNDTASHTIQAFEPLCGTYTVGGTGANFNDFSEVIYALTNWGISCPVIFNVNAGVYNEQLRFGEITGANSVNTVTFVGNGSVNVQYSPSVNTERHVLLLDSTKYFRFENITFEATSSATYGWVVHMMNACNDIRFSNCVFNANITTTSSYFAGLVANGSTTSATSAGTGVSNLLLEDCTVNGGYYGVVMYGLSASPMNNNVFSGNIFNNQYYHGIYLAYNQSPIISDNIFNGRLTGSTTVSSRAIHFYYAYGPWEISNNKIIDQGLYGIYMSSSSSTTTSSIIVNNMIGGGFKSTSTSASGIYVTGSNNIRIWYNSILFDGSAGRAIYLLSGLSNIDFRNNSMAFTGTGAGYAYYAASTTMFLHHNHNNYYSTGTNFVYYGSALTNLAVLQAVNQPAGNDANSRSGNPNYVSSTDLHAISAQLWGGGTSVPGITTDFDGDIRNPSTPCIGADEFSVSPLDAGIWNINTPAYITDANTSVSLQVTIRNFGSQPLTSIPVSYTINGGTPVTQTWTGNLASNDTVLFTFSTPFTVPQGQYSICARTNLAGDGNPGNDEKCVDKYGLPLLSLPHFDDFEGTVYWYSDASNDWEHGQPSASIINTAYSPINVWATKLAGNYTDNVSSFLYTPKFNFSNVSNMLLGFWHWIECENGVDGGKIQYSTNNGATWTTLGIHNDPSGTNWYNAANINNHPAFSGSSAGWQYSEISLSQFDNYPLPVQFRFHFYASPTVNSNGWAIDNFDIYADQIPYDAGVIAIEAPVAQSVTSSPNQVTVRIKNFGTETLTSIPLTYRVMTGMPPVNATWSGSLVSGAETSYTFSQTYIGPVQTPYNLCAWTNLTGDVFKFNDTTCVSLIAGPANYDAGVIDIISPAGNTAGGSVITVSVMVKNLGLNPISNIPLQYSVNGTPQATEPLVQTLAAGEEVVFTFATTFISPASQYQLCAKTIMSGDGNYTNDEFCREVTVDIETFEHVDGVYLLQNIPNPAQEITRIGFILPDAGNLKFILNNIIGQTLHTETSFYNRGEQYIDLNTENLAPGIYYYSIIFDHKKLTRKMVVSE